ncbi:Glycosyltransferase involved in cell wall bisynthesis [Prevotellaceae bacterium KH2P17]|nr:Glycosyltransferase involved in cell wall bisynthesis [Prevotellaceae bacterium KH2P17]
MKHYDIVQTHLTYPQFYVAIANLFVHTHIITTEHSTNNRRRGSRIFSRIDKWMYNRYEKIITISEKAEEKLREYLHDNSSDDIITIDNGIDVASFYEAKESRELRKGSDRFVMVMVASMHWQKDQDTIIRAMQYLPQDRFEFWIVGVGNRKPILEKLAKDLHVDSQVMFLGERTDIATILHTADVAIMSSHFEGLSLSSVEGMSVGHPFIASDVDGLHDTVVDAGILFPHEDAKALAKIVMRLDSDKEFYHEVAGKCLERAKQYDLQKTVTAYFNVYNKVYATSAAKS